MKFYLAILWAVLIIITGCTNDHQAKYETISIKEISTKQKEGYIILDVREKNEFDEGHIPNAQNKPFTELHLGNFDHLKKSNKYIVICRSGTRSEDASNILAEKGYNIMNVNKGMSSWNGKIVK